MELRTKIECINDIIQVAVQEQNLQQAENEQLIEQLEEENKTLRELLNIHYFDQIEDSNNDEKICIDSQYLQKQASEQQQSKKDPKNENESIFQDINTELTNYEKELENIQNDYLAILREEQDLQFNKEIDEHKEIIQKIYDEKLQEKSEQIELELTESMSIDIREEIRKDLKGELTRDLQIQLKDELREDVKDELREEVIEALRKELVEQVVDEFKQEIREQLTLELTSQIHQEIKEKYELAMQQQLRAMQNQFTNNQYPHNNIQQKQNQNLENNIQIENSLNISYNSKNEDQGEEEMDEDFNQKDFVDEQDNNLRQYIRYQDDGENDGNQQAIEEQRQQEKLSFEQEKFKFKQELMVIKNKAQIKNKPLKLGLQITENQETLVLDLQSPKQLTNEQQQVEKISQDFESQQDILKNNQQISNRKSEENVQRSESSGNKTSDDMSDENLHLNNYNFRQIFEDQALSKEEEDLFNQLIAREGTVGQDNNFSPSKGIEYETFAEDDEEKKESKLLQDPYQQSFRAQRMQVTNDQVENEECRTVNSDEQLTPRRSDNAPSNQNQFDNTDLPLQISRNHNQYQGFQGQTIKINSEQSTTGSNSLFNNNQGYTQQMQQRATHGGALTIGAQGLQRGSQEASPNIERIISQQIEHIQDQNHNPNQEISQISSSQQNQIEQGQITQDQYQYNLLQDTSHNQYIRAQGYQGQCLSSSELQLHSEQDIQQIGDSIGDEDDQQISNYFEGKDIQEIEDEYNDFFQGLQQEIKGNQQLGLMSSNIQEGSTFQQDNEGIRNQNINALNNFNQDAFGDQLEQELKFQQQLPLNSNFSVFLQDDESGRQILQVNQNEDEYDELSALDSTKGLMSLLSSIRKSKNKESDENQQEEGDQMEDPEFYEERDEANEEVYDYFLDAHKDENHNQNQGYHIIDQADLLDFKSDENSLKQSDDRDDKNEFIDHDDLDQIQDDELREYRYQNMLEDLKENLLQEEEDILLKKNQQ